MNWFDVRTLWCLENKNSEKSGMTHAKIKNNWHSNHRNTQDGASKLQTTFENEQLAYKRLPCWMPQPWYQETYGPFCQVYSSHFGVRNKKNSVPFAQSSNQKDLIYKTRIEIYRFALNLGLFKPEFWVFFKPPLVKTSVFSTTKSRLPGLRHHGERGTGGDLPRSSLSGPSKCAQLERAEPPAGQLDPEPREGKFWSQVLPGMATSVWVQ